MAKSPTSCPTSPPLLYKDQLRFRFRVPFTSLMTLDVRPTDVFYGHHPTYHQRVLYGWTLDTDDDTNLFPGNVYNNTILSSRTYVETYLGSGSPFTGTFSFFSSSLSVSSPGTLQIPPLPSMCRCSGPCGSQRLPVVFDLLFVPYLRGSLGDVP